MPVYTYECVKSDGGCGHLFEIFQLMSDYTSSPPNCPQCDSMQNVKRNFLVDIAITQIATQTVGSLAEKNSKNFSQEHKERLHKKHNAYRFKEHEMSLPKGASWMGEYGNREISTKQELVPRKKKRDVIKSKRKKR